MNNVRILDWGLVPYEEALLRQKALVREVIGGAPDAFVLCEHPKTITLGRKFQKENLFLPAEEFERQGFTVCSVDRGGDVTLHAPGQLVLYPIIDLKRRGLALREYLQKLEQVVVDLLAGFAIVAKGDDARRGVWVGRDKIASIGIGVSRWVTYHGVGLNVNTDLSLFRLIRPCGLDVRMTSIEVLKGQTVDMPTVCDEAAKRFKMRINGLDESSPYVQG